MKLILKICDNYYGAANGLMSFQKIGRAEMNKKLIQVIFLLSVFLSSAFILPSFGEDTLLQDVINKIQANQSKINDMYAETTTTITSNMTMPGQESKGPQKMIQKSKMWTKGQDKSKIEMLSPTRQITITNGDQKAIINPESGQKVVQDLKKLREKSGGLVVGQSGGQMTLDKVSEFFYLSVRKLDPSTSGGIDTYIITGVPKKENKFMGRMEFYVDGEKWLPFKIIMYDPKNRPMSQTEIEYQQVSDVWAPAKNLSSITTPMGSMRVDMEYSNLKINQGMSDKIFEI